MSFDPQGKFVPAGKHFDPAVRLGQKSSLTFSLPANLTFDGHEWSLAQPCPASGPSCGDARYC